MLHTDAGLVVAFGSPGLGVFDATTLDWDATASAPYFDPTWWLPDYGNAIYALALPGSPQGTLAASAVGSPGKLVIGGSIARWKDRVAGNVVRTTIGADTVAPTASGPRAVPRAGFSLTSAAVPVKVLWTGADLHGSGVASYDLAVSVSGSAYTTLRTGVASPTLDTSFASGKTYRFRVRARDFAGNVGAWVTGATLSGSLVQQTSSSIRFSTGWTTLSNTSYSGGTAKARSIAGAAVSYTFTGRGVALVTTLGPTRGQAKVYVDGHYVKTLDLKASTTRYRAVAWSWGWTTSGTHTVRLVVVGTAGRPRVEVDAFAIVR